MPEQTDAWRVKAIAGLAKIAVQPATADKEADMAVIDPTRTWVPVEERLAATTATAHATAAEAHA
ncbi:hypothetical protein [Mycolicibacterium alvei]|uniref:Uncharacterized protein n=1 Tax=Mycolicibacterium alvei TaxID=67081 RepID=A0A6N4USL7_9MYCO|nr:hypothetical protein [Mycolicibacterium alvei]MCV7001414.1 hypothetical protein [Mycolicibacterium alvei]BBX26863.1 hypothetical protein MALV_19880 [Mycolicibacterium alvei]